MEPIAFIPAHVRFVGVAGQIFLLDLRLGEYLCLTSPQAALWRRLVGIVHSATDPANDLIGFRSAMVDRGLLSTVPVDPAPRVGARPAPTSRPTTWLALRCILRADRAVSKRRFGSFYRRLVGLGKPATDPDENLIAAVLAAYLKAEALLFLRRQKDDCLPRSLALYELCVLAGLGCDHVIGVKAAPFTAHAWVQIGDRFLLEGVETVRGYTPIAVI
jgi:hypothetical protein